MSEFFLELFSEEIPAGSQQNSRNALLESFQKLFVEKQISFKKSSSFFRKSKSHYKMHGEPGEPLGNLVYPMEETKKSTFLSFCEFTSDK